MIPARVIDLGTRDYAEVWRMQLDLVAARQRDEVVDTLVLVEHPHVLTLGRSAKRENLLHPEGTDIYQIERGGDVTYHGPGQLVGYPILLLRPEERDLHRYLRNLEQGLIDAVGSLGLHSAREPGKTGVWIPGPPARKLASIGVAVKRWVTMHGFALNVCTDLSRFGAINPCGFEASVMTSVEHALGQPVSVATLAPTVIERLGQTLGRAFAA